MSMRLGWCAVLILGLVTANAALYSQEGADEPGPIHKFLAKRAGEYTTITKFSGPGIPDSPPTKGTSKIKSILGGRFVQQEDSGEMLGKKFTSVHLDGYNNLTKTFESTWIYTGGTGMMSMTGKSDDGGKTIHYVATYSKDAGKKETMYIDTKHIDDDNFEVVLYSKLPDGAKGPMMHMKYTRKK